jgi:menaquinone-dependent protoporphyrinogen IX oxidase
LGKILVIYDSGYGATADAAKTIAGNLTGEGLNVDLSFVGLKDPVGYDAAIVGSPIRFGQCTPKIKKFLKTNHSALTRMQVAFFFTCMSVTNDISKLELPLYIDPIFNDPNKPRARIKIMENNHAASYYLNHFLKKIAGISPLSISFFKGGLNISKLSIFHRLVMRFAMFALPEIQNGDYLNKTAIRDWAGGLAIRLKYG